MQADLWKKVEALYQAALTHRPSLGFTRVDLLTLSQGLQQYNLRSRCLKVFGDLRLRLRTTHAQRAQGDNRQANHYSSVSAGRPAILHDHIKNRGKPLLRGDSDAPSRATQQHARIAALKWNMLLNPAPVR